MQQVVSVNSKVLNDILSSLDEVKKEVKKLHKKMESLKPAYGTDAWWEKSTQDALGEVKKGEVFGFDNAKDLIKSLQA